MVTLWTIPSQPSCLHGRWLIISELLGYFQHFSTRASLFFHYSFAMRACFHLVPLKHDAPGGPPGQGGATSSVAFDWHLSPTLPLTGIATLPTIEPPSRRFKFQLPVYQPPLREVFRYEIEIATEDKLWRRPVA
jgi:hypothetical protein